MMMKYGVVEPAGASVSAGGPVSAGTSGAAGASASVAASRSPGGRPDGEGLQTLTTVCGRFEAARHAAVQLLKPNVVYVPLPKRTLNDEPELKAWLAEVETLIAAKLKNGPVMLTLRTRPDRSCDENPLAGMAPVRESAGAGR